MSMSELASLCGVAEFMSQYYFFTAIFVAGQASKHTPFNVIIYRKFYFFKFQPYNCATENQKVGGPIVAFGAL
jgi:hypothetical protein